MVRGRCVSIPSNPSAPLLHPEHSSPFELAGLRHALKQLLRYDQHLVANLDKGIVDIAMETDRLIGRECPWGGRPDHDGDQLDTDGERDAGNVWLSTVGDVTNGNFT